MADYRLEARRAAKRYGLDPYIFERQIKQESGFNPNARSPAGATGIAQIMPGTAKGWGVNPSDPIASLNAAAKNMAGYVKKYGGYENALRAYNAGPGAIEASRGYSETNNYVKTILGGRVPGALGQPSGSRPSTGGAPSTSAPSSAAIPAAPSLIGQGQGSDFTSLLSTMLAAPEQQAPPSSPLQAPAFSSALKLPAGVALLGGSAPQASGSQDRLSGALSLVEALGARTPGIGASEAPATADAVPEAPIAETVQADRSNKAAGASSALAWAESKIGFKETGENRGGLADYANKRFGMSGQPWCAMFTSLAVTKGGAPKVARTASVQEVRRQAEQGGGGYQSGFVKPDRAQAGDLILFGNDHVGMVQRVEGGKVFYVGGNQSDGVTEASVPAGKGDIVRPKYGARSR